MKNNYTFSTISALFCLLATFALSTQSCNPAIPKTMNANTMVLEDGMYLVERGGNHRSVIYPLAANEKIITWNENFLEYNKKMKYLIVNTEEFAAIQLTEEPVAEPGDNGFKKLDLSLNDQATKDFALFTKKHLNKMIAIVVGGEALSKHQIRAVIDGGKIQITRCNDNACEKLMYELKDKVTN